MKRILFITLYIYGIHDCSQIKPNNKNIRNAYKLIYIKRSFKKYADFLNREKYLMTQKTWTSKSIFYTLFPKTNGCFKIPYIVSSPRDRHFQDDSITDKTYLIKCFVLFLFSKTIDGCHGYIVFKYQDMAVVNIYIAFIYIFLKIES